MAAVCDYYEWIYVRVAYNVNQQVVLYRESQKICSQLVQMFSRKANTNKEINKYC